MKKLLIILLLTIVPGMVMAQKKDTKAKAPKAKTAKAGKAAKPQKHEKQLPSWAEAQHYDASSYAYFPDYYTYYDPQRGGYLFWMNGKYTFTPTMPPFMEKVDMSTQRVQLLKGLSLDLHPEQNYPRYMKLYPAEHSYDKVPVPVTGDH